MCHVLIIEDEVLVGVDLALILEDNGASSVDFATTECQAVSRALDVRPDFVVSDYQLAQGTGAGAVETIRAAYGAVPVIFVTSVPDACRADNDTVVLAKPFLESELIATFHQLRRRHARAA